MQIATTRFGYPETIDVPEEALVNFPEGLPGFETVTRFALVEDTRYAPFTWLQALDEPTLGFITIHPTLVEPTYAFELSAAAMARLGLDGARPPHVLCIVSAAGTHPTVNLKAPLVINPDRRCALQVVLQENYSLRHPLPDVPAAGGPPC